MLEKIACPHCSQMIEISKILYNKLEKNFQEKSSKLEQDLTAQFDKKLQEQKLVAWKMALEKAQEANQKKFTEMNQTNLNLKKQFQAQLDSEKSLQDKLQKQEQKMLKLQFEARKELEEEKAAMQKKLTENLKQERDLMELQIKNQFSNQIEQEREKTRLEQQKTKQMESDILSLKRKLEQGSMQLQGDASENTIKAWLGDWFPSDTITDVPTGIKGADLIQTVYSEGMESGKIVFESKNTKEWSSAWIGKLKHDQGLVKADIAILVSKSLPKEVEHFTVIEGVFVVSFQHLKPLVSALRFHLENIYRLSNSLENRDEKIQFLYKYLSGPQFKNRIENIVYAFKSLKEGLDTEKRAMQRIWNKREKEIEKVIDNTAGLYGDMQGIIGGSLPTIELLELPE